MNSAIPIAEANLPRTRRPSLSVVIPAFNEADNLPGVLGAVVAKLHELTERWEVLVVDDGSRDATPLVIRPWLATPGVRYLRLSRNFGKESALTAGIDRAAGDVVALMDADGQHPVAMLDSMLAAWRGGADMVCAVRASRADESLGKRLGARLFYRVTNAGATVCIPEGAGDFRLMDRRVVDALKTLHERNRFMKGLYAWVGFETRLLTYTPAERASGHSSFSARRLLRLALTGITSFSNLPLRVWSGIGALIAVPALGYGLWIVIESLITDNPVSGWPTLVTAVMFFGGVQLLSVGILGEYVGRIFDEVKQRPVYVIGSETGLGAIEAAPAAPVAGTAEVAARQVA